MDMKTSLIFTFLLVILDIGSSRHTHRYSELEDEDKELLRAAYETPSYHEDYAEDDLQVGKVDLMKDGLWALKAKIKELKAFDKALVAHMLSTKLKLKDFIENHHNLVVLKKHHHEPVVYGYQSPSYSQGYTHSAAPAQSYPPQPSSGQGQPYSGQGQQYSGQAQQYSGQAQQYSGQAQQYSSGQAQSSAQAYTHDPYYGH